MFEEIMSCSRLPPLKVESIYYQVPYEQLPEVVRDSHVEVSH